MLFIFCPFFSFPFRRRLGIDHRSYRRHPRACRCLDGKTAVKRREYSHCRSPRRWHLHGSLLWHVHFEWDSRSSRNYGRAAMPSASSWRPIGKSIIASLAELMQIAAPTQMRLQKRGLFAYSLQITRETFFSQSESVVAWLVQWRGYRSKRSDIKGHKGESIKSTSSEVVRHCCAVFSEDDEDDENLIYFF